MGAYIMNSQYMNATLMKTISKLNSGRIPASNVTLKDSNAMDWEVASSLQESMAEGSLSPYGVLSTKGVHFTFVYH